MQQIPCPWCGVRDETEFRFGGEAPLSRPAAEVDDAAWAAYLFDTENAKGLARERWFHRHGCGGWFVLVRDTLTHEIRGAHAPETARGETEDAS